MNKLKLQLDTLRVETFDAGPDNALPGTVDAHDGSVYTYDNYQQTCGGLSCQVACRTRYQNTCQTACV
jgi:hypothetical protein